MPAPENTPAERLSMYLAALRRHWLLVLGIVAVAVLAGVLVASLGTRSFEATAKVLIGQRAQVDALLGAANYAPDPERDVNTNLELITLEPVAEQASRKLDLGLPPAALTSRVETAIAGNSNVVWITARDSSPERAARIANAFAEAYRAFRTRSAQASIDDAVASAQRRSARLGSGPERDALDEDLRRLKSAAAFQTGGVQIVRRATAASAAASGSIIASAIVAGLLGLVLAAVAVVVLARTDKRVRSGVDLEAAAGCPVLATVSTSFKDEDPAGARDGLATLAVSLALRSNGRSPSVLLLTSPGPGEGTTEVALGLALALGDMGHTVIAIEADLRAPAFADQLRLEPAAGLAGILGGARTLDDELVEITWAPGGAAPAWVVPAGSGFGLPQPLLAGHRMRVLVAEARTKAALVILAGAPAAQFGDTFGLTPLADAVVLVGRVDRTRRDEAQRVVRELEELGRPPVGAVATTGRPGRGTGPAGPWRRRPPVAPPPLDSALADSNGSRMGSSSKREVTAP